jgi:1-acyl-sn-glycerol-3-phosphate acyltransferase
MKLKQLSTLWILSSLVIRTLRSSVKALSKSYFGRPTRAWTDQVIHTWASHWLDTARVNYTVENPNQTQPKPGVPTILMSNHASAYDIPLLFKIYPEHSTRMLAKKELSKIPFFGRGMRASEFPFIDRQNRHQAVKDLAYAQQLMESGILIWIAPEGTRSKTGKLLPFKKGAFVMAIQSKATIIPVGIRGAEKILPTHSFDINLDQKVTIHIGKAIDASEFTLDEKDSLLQQTYEAMKMLVGEV